MLKAIQDKRQRRGRFSVSGRRFKTEATEFLFEAGVSKLSTMGHSLVRADSDKRLNYCFEYSMRGRMG